MINWLDITGTVGRYIYTGGANPWEYGGAWIDPTTGHIVRIHGLDCGLTDYAHRPVAVVESLQVYDMTPRRIRVALACMGQTLADLHALPKDQRRFAICDAALAYGHYDPANEFPAHHTVTTHRETAAFRAVNTYLR